MLTCPVQNSSYDEAKFGRRICFHECKTNSKIETLNEDISSACERKIQE